MTTGPSKGQDPGAQPPERVTSTWQFVKEFLSLAVVVIAVVIVGFAAFTAAAYVALPEKPVILYLGAGAFYTAAAWYLYEAVDMWRGERASGRRASRPVDPDEDQTESDVGRGGCFEAPFTFLLLNTAFFWFLESELWIASLAAAALCGVLWLSTVLLHWPRLLMPAIHRKAETR